MLCDKDGKPLTPLPVPRSPDEVRAAELRNEALFKEAPPEDDCPLCGLRFPMKSETIYRKCNLSQIDLILLTSSPKLT